MVRSTLTVVERAIIVSYLAKGYSQRKTAEKLGKTRGQVRQVAEAGRPEGARKATAAEAGRRGGKARAQKTGSIQGRVIHFEDHGQDFPWWRLDGNRVVESSGQGWLWERTVVQNPEAEPGQKLRIMNGQLLPEWIELKYPIARVELLPTNAPAAAAGSP